MKASMMLSPIKLYSLFGKIPLALILHVLIITVDVIYMLNFIDSENDFMAAMQQVWYKELLDPKLKVDDISL